MQTFADFINEQTSETNDHIDLRNHILDVIQNEIGLRDVPYSMQEGDMEVDPDTLEDAADAVIKLLKAKGLI